jgi:DNA-binding NarL/FixJ family response regulator
VQNSVAQVLKESALDPRIQPQCSLAVQLRRLTGSVVGRATELAVIQQELREGKGRLTAVTLEGEPGIGKTRLLVAASEMASAMEYTTVAVTADEEIRGPFLLAQSIFTAPSLREAIVGTPASQGVQRVMAAVSGQHEQGLETLTPDVRLLRTFDLAAVALGAVAQQNPLALLIDDAQWADDDTLRLLRYVVRVDPNRSIFLFLTLRPNELASPTETVNLIADMERMGVVRRLRPERFSQAETGALAEQLLGGPVQAASITALHAQSEGVPFILEELLRAYRDAGLIQPVDGMWTLGRKASRLVPAAVRTLIQRRAARLLPETRAVLGDAAVLGRSFSLRDLSAIRDRLGEGESAPEALADILKPAVEGGLLLPHQEGAPADFTFAHEQIREFAMSELSHSRRRAIHKALVDLLLEPGEPTSAALPLLAHHALAAGDTGRAATLSVEAARAALQSNAPEEALRLVDQALPMVTTSEDRRLLLLTRDDAHAMLRNPAERLDGLAELAALAQAMGDSHFELDVQLRRSAALRLSHDEEAAAELAKRVRSTAQKLGDSAAELRADLELGQALMKAALGETFGPSAREADLAGAEAAYRDAIALAEQLGDERSLAAALRELAAIMVGKIRAWFVDQVESGQALELVQRVTAGEPVESVLASSPVAAVHHEAAELFERALAIFERLGDRTGVMSTVIAMAYINYAPMIHIASSARHIEEIRRVTGRLSALVTESERQRLELQMLFGVHVYARAKVVPDLMVSRGIEAHRVARVLGDRSVEFLAAGGVALSFIELGDLAEAEAWLAKASAAVGGAPTPLRARLLELWRGKARAAAGDAEGMIRHLDQAVKMATATGHAAARCEALAELALEAARIGFAINDDQLAQRAEQSSAEAAELSASLPGHPPFRPRADAAAALAALARGELERAAKLGGAALHALEASLHEDTYLDIVLPAARAVLAGGQPEEQAMMRGFLQLTLSRIARGTVDGDLRVRWLRGPVGRELVELAGPVELAAVSAEGETAAAERLDFDAIDRRLLHLLTQGSTNREMADELHLDESEVSKRLARLLATMGASTRAEATSLAFRTLAA